MVSKERKEKIVALVLAGGTGERMGSNLPKQFLELGGKPLIMHSVLKFEESPVVSDIIIVCHKSHIVTMKSMLEHSGVKKLQGIIPGGNSRQASSLAGIKACSSDTSIVLLHDAARPFLTDSIIEDVARAAKSVGAAGPAIDMQDTVVEEENGLVKNIPPRSALKRIQTPQAFKYELILKAHEEAARAGHTDYSDDCGMILAIGEPVKLSAGDTRNIKITDKKDLHIAEGMQNIQK